jgi:hypothetical protein
MTLSGHRRLTPVWISLILVAAAYLITLAMLERDAVWVADNGNKLIQLKGILRSGYRDYSIELRGSEIDPGLQYSPIQPPFGAIKEYRLYSIFSPVFATISTFPYRALGSWGLYVIPSLSTVIMLLGLVRILDLFGAGAAARVYAVIIAGLCTPVWFYSVVFWEHSPAGCLGILSSCLLSRPPMPKAADTGRALPFSQCSFSASCPCGFSSGGRRASPSASTWRPISCLRRESCAISWTGRAFSIISSLRPLRANGSQ